jgi:hypothetical protein
MRVFLCGPMSGQNNNIPAFQEARTIIYKKEVECYAPPLMLTKIDYDNQPELIKNLVKMMCVCSHVVTIEEWHEDKVAKTLVDIARLMQIPVQHFSTWKGGKQ